MSSRKKFLVVVLIILLAAASRLVRHPFNFTPIAAMALFAGAYLGKKWGLVLPLAAMFVSDIFIGFYEWQVMVSVYLGIALIFGIGWLLENRKKWYFVGLASLSSSIIFFLLTNFAVWLFFSWYSHTWQGLISCFVLALPFFRNTLLGDLFYSGILFGAYEIILALSARRISEKI